MCISDWSSDVCSSDLRHKGAWDHLGLVVGVAIREANAVRVMAFAHGVEHEDRAGDGEARLDHRAKLGDGVALAADDTGEIGEDGVEGTRSEEHTSELQSLMRISYAVFCSKKKTTIKTNGHIDHPAILGKINPDTIKHPKHVLKDK